MEHPTLSNVKPSHTNNGYCAVEARSFLTVSRKAGAFFCMNNTPLMRLKAVLTNNKDGTEGPSTVI
jgi:hypothetical protein